ncbi:MAG: hypothetical protein EPO65_03805 [Dehalococcoidia bacterium]|nr:MAG: hypothetical protein EPO65_03805 [Dehalococcoidia bacterium]
MDVTTFLARFWGSLFMLLGLQALLVGLIRRTIEMTEERAVTVSTGYITFLLGLATVILHNVWVANWTVSVTLLGWTTPLKGFTKIGFPEHVHRQAQMFRSLDRVWGGVIFLLGAWLFWMSVQ